MDPGVNGNECEYESGSMRAGYGVWSVAPAPGQLRYSLEDVVGLFWGFIQGRWSMGGR